MSHQHRCQKNHWLANCELVKVTSGHDGRDSIPRLCLECRQPCGVVGGTWKWKLLTRRTKGKGTLDPPDKALLTVCLSSFSLSYSFSSFPICISSYLPLLLLLDPSDAEREIHAAPHVSEKLIQLFRNKSEFTFLATVQQKPSTSGVILSIRELEHR